MVQGSEPTGTDISAADAGIFMLGGELPVRRIGYGAMRLTGQGDWGEPRDPAAARAVLQRAVALGVNLIDTAWAYGPYIADRLIMEALYPYPADLVIATKLGGARDTHGGWYPAARPEQLRAACEAELRALRLDQFALVHLRYLEMSDVPIAESVGALVRLREEGKVRLIGVSNVSAAQVAEAQIVTPIASVQNLYNLAHRADDALIDVCTVAGIAFMPFLPLLMGGLTGNIEALAGAPLPPAITDRAGRIAAVVTAIAESRGVTTAQVVLAWLLARSPATVPIPGTTSLAHLDENIAAGTLRLTDEERMQLEAV